MKLFPKILLIIGLALLGLGLLVPDNYERCHSDVIIGGHNPFCPPDWVFQIDKLSFYVAIGCIITSFILASKSDAKAGLLNE